ncbi:MAG: RAD55 family ATPase [Methanosarcinaceae archaeon]|jgi:KaiC/GvpD/RAD55 family RecA-like ATPase|nr:RAD55 family ATPase [Methanosarcinaceae archaeon]NKQ39448.1 hypothetical protein [Methanosarcinales archaeon]
MIESMIGLNTLPKKSVLLIEEDIGDIKSILVQQIGYEMAKLKQNIYYISTKKLKEDIINQMLLFGMNDVSNLSTFNIYEKNNKVENSLDVCNNDLLHSFFNIPLQKLNEVDILIIDSFSSLYIDKDSSNSLKNLLDLLLNASRKNNLIVLLTLDMGILSKRDESIMRFMVDGIIQFKTSYSDNSIHRSINIPKMKDNFPYDKLVSFYLTDKGMAADRRERIG